MPNGLRFEPLLPPGLDALELTGLTYRALTIDLHVARGRAPTAAPPFLPADETGHRRIEVTV